MKTMLKQMIKTHPSSGTKPRDEPAPAQERLEVHKFYKLEKFLLKQMKGLPVTLLLQLALKHGGTPKMNQKWSMRTQDKFQHVRSNLEQYMTESGLQDEMRHGVNNSKLWINMMIYMQLRKLQQADLMQKAGTRIVKRRSSIEETNFMLKLVTTIYGPMFVAKAYYNKHGKRRVSGCGHSHLEAMNFHLNRNYQEQDLLVSNWDNDYRKATSHMVLVDHERKQTFLVIQETQSMYDVFSDLECLYRPILWGSSSQWICK